MFCFLLFSQNKFFNLIFLFKKKKKIFVLNKHIEKFPQFFAILDELFFTRRVNKKTTTTRTNPLNFLRHFFLETHSQSRDRDLILKALKEIKFLHLVTKL